MHHDEVKRDLLSLVRSRSVEFPAIPGYEIQEQLGSGGCGNVYLAYNKVLNEFNAVKTLLPGRDQDRFLNECKIHSKLSHPSIVRFVQAGMFPSAGQEAVFLAMEYVDGVDLQSKIRSSHMNADEIKEVFNAVCDALSHSHALGIYHRDIKPSNVLLSKNGRFMLTDFGIAIDKEESTRVITSGVSPHTELYVSPEVYKGRVRGDSVSADIYSCGILLLELVAGKTPHMNLRELDEITDSNRDWKAVIARAVHEDPKQRFDTAESLKAAVGACHSWIDRGESKLSVPTMETQASAPKSLYFNQEKVDQLLSSYKYIQSDAQAKIDLTIRRCVEESKRDIVVRKTSSLSIGDALVLVVSVETSCFITLVNIGTSGGITVLFPNAESGVEKPLPAGGTFQFPSESDEFDFQLTGPVGRETILAVASTGPLGLAPSDVGQSSVFSNLSHRDISVVRSRTKGIRILAHVVKHFEVT